MANNSSWQLGTTTRPTHHGLGLHLGIQEPRKDNLTGAYKQPEIFAEISEKKDDYKKFFELFGK